MKTFTGIPVSAGVVTGTAYVYMEDEIPEISRYAVTQEEIPAEWERLQKALGVVGGELAAQYEKANREMSREQSDIFLAHLMMLEDIDFHEQINIRLKKSLHNIEWVVWEQSQEISQKLQQSPDPALRERSADIIDVSRRIINNLLSVTSNRSSLANLDKDVILAAHDLMPSDVLTMNKARIKGIVLDEGSKTCHTAILLRAFNIPTVLGLAVISREVTNGETLALNGNTGVVVVAPDAQTLVCQRTEEQNFLKQRKELETLKNLPAETTDGHRVTLKANIGFPEEAEAAREYGAEGIGLYRTEFLFFTPGQSADEETQYNAYSHVLKTMETLPVTIRTVDLGGDKVSPELQSAPEKNPLLGWRAIRLSLANPELFRVQLRAILRAGVHGNARIMFPMISGLEELEQARLQLETARAECAAKGRPFAENMEVGIMIEVPSAAMIADILAEQSAFFSIGTNDLIQYSIAVDRGNEKISYLGDSCHPAILRFLQKTIDGAHAKGIKAAMCGELAGDPSMTALLLGLGLDEFSMTATAIPRIKKVIRSVSLESCRKLAEAALTGRSAADVRSIIQAWTAQNLPAESGSQKVGG